MRRLLLVVPLVLGVVWGPLAGAAQSVRTLVFPRFNDSYSDLSSDIVPVSAGGLTLELRSPRNRLDLISHRVEIAPLENGSFDVVVTVGVGGEADLQLSFGDGLPALEDVVVVPEQEVVLAGRAAVVRVDAGWEVTPLALPETASLRLESALAGQLVATCGLLALVTPGVKCDGLDRALSVVALPLPDPGETYIVDATAFTQEEVESIDRALDFVP